MESKIDVLLEESLSQVNLKFKEDNIFKQFEIAKNEFQDLIKKGFTQERGNNLLSLSDSKSVSRIVFNTK